MRSPFMLTFILLSSLALFAIPAEADGREAVVCNTVSQSGLSNMQIADGECILYDLGVIPDSTVLEFTISITNDAVDVFIMRENVFEAYSGGYSHLHVVEDSSTLSAIGSQTFHWQPDDNDAFEEFRLVIDNLDHTNDNDEGDFGGGIATVQIQLTESIDSYWTEYHNIVALEAGSHEEILDGDDLTLDAGTEISITAWPMFGSPDIYLMDGENRETYLSQESGPFSIEEASKQSLGSQTSWNWTVPESHDGSPLYLMVDNEGTPSGGGDGTEEARVTVKVEIDPVLDPRVVDDLDSAAAVLGQKIELDATSTPNLASQIQTLVWDLDINTDSDGDGDLQNDADATGWRASTMFYTPGTQRVLLTVTSPTGATAQEIHELSVVDVNPPSVSITHDTSSNSVGEILAPVGEMVKFTAVINDDHTVSAKRWTLDGVEVSSDVEWTKGWTTLGSHDLTLQATDVSGNSASTEVVIRVVDSTAPVIYTDDLLLPTEVTAGVKMTFDARSAVSDTWDDVSDLEFRWDFNLERDSDGDGIKWNDPEVEGPVVDIVFTEVGEESIRLVVIDQSGNVAYHSFSVEVEPAPEDNTLSMIMTALVIIIVVTAVGAILWRQKEMGTARHLLASHGLTEEEILNRISFIKAERNPSFFARGAEIAGLEDGSDKPMTEEERAEAAKQAELQRLYGAGTQADPNAGFQPAGASRSGADAEFAAMAGIGSAPVMDEAQQAAALEAASLFSDESPGQVKQQKTAVQPQAASQPKPAQPAQPVGSKGSCSSCGQAFAVQLPDGVSEVLVDCPKCGVEQLFQR